MKPGIVKLDALTGLRFFAAFAVFVHHFGDRFRFFDVEGPLGAQAVSFFFVLSGFILTYVYQGRLEKGGTRKFLFTRWARIWPLHAICLLAVLLLFSQSARFGGGADQARLASHWLLLQSWVPLKDWIFCYNGVSWSISTELFFYLMFPLFFIAGQKSFWRKYFVLIGLTLSGLVLLKFLAGVPAVANTISLKELIHVNPLFRLIEFATGMATGFIFINRQSVVKRRNFWIDSSLETVVLVAAVGYDWFLRHFLIYYSIRQASWGGPELVMAMVYSGGLVFFAPLIYVFARSRGLWGRISGCRLMVFLGEISFAFYMVHQIVLRIAFSKWWAGSTMSPSVAFLGTALIAIGVSSFLYFVFEIPLKNGLLKLYHRQPLAAFWATVEPGRKFLVSRIGVASVLLICLPVLYFSASRTEDAVSPTAEQIMNRTPLARRELELGADVTLMGWTLEPRRGGVQLNLVWRKEAAFEGPFTRTFYLVGEAKEAPLFERTNFMAEGWRVGDYFVERFFIHRHRYRNNQILEVGLTSNSRKGTPEHRQVLINGPRMATVAAQSGQLKLR